MAKTAVEQWDTTAANNTDINSIPIDGAVTTPSQVDNIIREMMAQVAVQMGEMNFEGADIASATTTNLANATGWSLDITGTTTITGLGTVAAGKVFILRFTGALTFTHNATSLILPGAANITTAANDVAVMKSEGSGNWRCVMYQRASGVPIGGLPASSTDNAIARFDGTAGVVQNSSATVDDSGFITSAGRFIGAADVVLGNSGAGGVVALRPNGGGSTTGQVTLDSTGRISFGAADDSAILGTSAGTGAMFFRPKGVGSATDQMSIDNNGDVIINGTLTVTG